MPLRQDFGSFRRPVDTVSPLQKALSNVQQTFAQMQQDEENKRRYEQDLLFKEAAERRAQAAESRAAKEYARQVAQDKALGEALMGIGSKAGKSTVIPETTIEKNILGSLTPGEVEGLAQGKANLEELLKGLETEALQKQKRPDGPGEFTGEVSPAGIPLRAGESASIAPKTPTFIQRGTRGAEAEPLIQPLYDTSLLFAGSTGLTKTTDTTIPMKVSTKEPIEEKSSMLPIPDKIKQVKKDINLYDQLTKQAIADIGKDRATTQTVTVPERIETSTLSRNEWLSRELERGKRLGLSGEAAAKYQEVLTKRAGQLYGSSKPMTLSDQLKLLKYQQGQKEKALTLNDYETLYPNQRGKIKTLDGFKAYEKKLGKTADKKFNIAEDLYKNMTGKDTGDVDAIFEFLSTNNQVLGNMSNDALRTLAAQLKAKYANEASVLDPTDYLGGSAAGDVLTDVTLR